MTAVCVAGMHRSGTSMTARLLNLGGVHLGPQADIVPATVDNADGHWENVKFVAVNDEILAELGGGWDYPPPLPDGWEETEALARLCRKASVIVQDFSENPLWGWKDPRSSLLPQFWQSVVPDLKFVICVRHPFEVADSLQRRNMFSRPRSLDLWREYNQRLLQATTPEHRLITHYDTYFVDARAELSRLFDFLGTPLSAEALETSVGAVRSGLRHNRARANELLNARVSSEILDLYEAICDEAGWRDTYTDGVLDEMSPTDGARDPRDEAFEQLRQRMQEHEAHVTRLAAELRQRDRQLQERDLKLRQTERQLARSEGEIDALRRDIVALRESTSWRVTAPLRDVAARLSQWKGGTNGFRDA